MNSESPSFANNSEQSMFSKLSLRRTARWLMTVLIVLGLGYEIWANWMVIQSGIRAAIEYFFQYPRTRIFLYVDTVHIEKPGTFYMIILSLLVAGSSFYCLYVVARNTRRNMTRQEVQRLVTKGLIIDPRVAERELADRIVNAIKNDPKELGSLRIEAFVKNH